MFSLTAAGVLFEGKTVRKEDAEAFRELLLEIRRRLVKNVAQMQHEVMDGNSSNRGELSDIPLEHLADRGSDTFTKDLMLGMIQDNEAEIIDIDSALEKIENGTYGICESCEQKIPGERMKAIPFARLCLGCKQIEERAEGKMR